MSPKVAEKKFNIKAAAIAIGISPSGVRLLLNQRSWDTTNQEPDA